MKPFKTTLKTGPSLIDLTPLVDVIFLLLIFFVASSDILPLKTLKIQNPILEKEAKASSQLLSLAMDRQGVIYFGPKKAIVDIKSVKKELLHQLSSLKNQNGGKEPLVVLNIDQKASYGDFLTLYALIEEISPQIRLSFTPFEETD